jgi:hypothetical protein
VKGTQDTLQGFSASQSQFKTGIIAHNNVLYRELRSGLSVVQDELNSSANLSENERNSLVEQYLASRSTIETHNSSILSFGEEADKSVRSEVFYI